MVKRLFYFAVSAIALTACTSQDVVDDVVASHNAIRFENVVNKHSRATDLDANTLKNFNVFGFYTMPENAKHVHEVFYNVPVSKSNDGVWGYEDKYTRFWVPGATYYFYAYSCGSASLADGFGTFSLDTDNTNEDGSEKNIDPDKRKMQIQEYSCREGHQHDLITASKIVQPTEQGYAVPFQFKHILSKIQAKFTSTFSDEYDVVISNVSVQNIRNKGEYEFGKGWTSVSRNTDEATFVYLLKPNVVDGKDINILTVNKSGKNNKPDVVNTQYAYVIPNEYQDVADDRVNFLFDIDVMYGSDRIMHLENLKATFTPDWSEGYSYIYNIDINAEALNMDKIEFKITTDITAWENGETPDNTPIDEK